MQCRPLCMTKAVLSMTSGKCQELICLQRNDIVITHLSVQMYHSMDTHEPNVSRFWHESRVSCRFRPEAEHSANAGLHIARELLEPIKKKYPGISYSDLWTLAGCVAVEEMGGE